MFKEAADAKKIGKKLINEIHTNLSSVVVEYIFCDDVIKVGGKEVPAKVVFVSDLYAWFATRESQPLTEFAVILIHRETWKLLDEQPDVHRAIIDHCLMRIFFDREKGVLKFRPYDIQEFAEIVQRNGAYNTDLKDFVQRVKNPRLPFEPLNAYKEPEPDTETAAEPKARKTRSSSSSGGGNSKAEKNAQATANE